MFTWGDAGSMGGTIVIAGRLQDVQRWGGEPGKLSGVSISADPGVTPKELAARVKAELPATVSVKTGEQAATDATNETAASITGFLTPVLLAFAGVSVFVGAFIIFNAFSITVAQRRREFAMLRALGASRRQVLRSVVAEALTLGVLASAVGIVAGLGVAKGINLLFKALGVDIPTAGIALEPRTIVIAALVGVGVTLLSALAPAMRATRVAPVAALQEGAALPPTRFTKFTTAIALAIAGLGGASLAYGIFSNGTTSNRLLSMGLGALLLFVAIAMLAKYIVRPAARIIGWPLEKLAPTSGRLARDNAGRNPSRTAATAAALMIGLAMVVFIAVFAQAMKGSFSGAIEKSTRAELVAQDRTAFMGVPQKTIRSLDSGPGRRHRRRHRLRRPQGQERRGHERLRRRPRRLRPRLGARLEARRQRRAARQAGRPPRPARGRLAARRQGQGRRQHHRHDPGRREGQAHRARLLPRPDGVHRHDHQPGRLQGPRPADRVRHHDGAPAGRRRTLARRRTRSRRRCPPSPRRRS